MIEVIGVMRSVLRCGSVASVLALFAAMLAASPAKAEVSEPAGVPAGVAGAQDDGVLQPVVETAGVVGSQADGVWQAVGETAGVVGLRAAGVLDAVGELAGIAAARASAAAGVAAAAGPAEVGDPVAAGAVVQASSGLCDVSGVSQFGDVAVDGYGAAHVLCARALGLTRGKADGSFGPDDDLTREQMAAFLVRLWRDVLDGDCPTGVSHGFEDVAGSFAEADIECLFGLGITKGTTASTFSPGATLSTAAVTLFVTRLLVRSGAATCDLSADEFRRAAACLTDLGVAASAEEALAPVAATRAMMAVYLVGAWHQASGRGQPPVSPTRPVVSAVVTNEVPLVVDHPAGLTVSVPVGALPDSARLVVTQVTAVPPASDGAAPAGPVLDVRVFGASGKEITELDAPAQLRLPVPPGGGDGVVIAYYHDALETWVPVATRVQGGDLVAELDHFTPVAAWDLWNEFKRVWGGVKDFWNSHVVATRIPRADWPTCTGSAPDWVVSADLDDHHKELLACVSSRGDVASLTLANNRGYPVVVRQGGTGAVAEPGGTRSVVTELYQWLYGLFYDAQSGDTVLRGLEEVSFGLTQPRTADGSQQTTTMHALSEDWGWVFSLITTAIDTAIPAEEVGDVLDVLLESVPKVQGAVCGTRKAEASVVQCAIDRLAQVTDIITVRLKHNRKLLAKITGLFGSILNSLNPVLGALSKGRDMLSGAAKAVDLFNSIDDNDPITITYQTRPQPATTPAPIAAGRDHTCALTTAGDIRCWGFHWSLYYHFDAYGYPYGPDHFNDWQIDAGDGTGFTAVTAGTEHTCAITTDGHAQCSRPSSEFYFYQDYVPDGTYTAIAAGGLHTCALTTAGRIRCWGYGYESDDVRVYVRDEVPAGTYTAVTAGVRHSCALTAAGRIRCWGGNASGQADPPAGTGFAAVAAGWGHSCALTAAGRIRCWGDNGSGQADPPAGTGFAAVAAGWGHSCALTADGRAECWGNNDYGRATPPAGATFAAPGGGS